MDNFKPTIKDRLSYFLWYNIFLLQALFHKPMLNMTRRQEAGIRAYYKTDPFVRAWTNMPGLWPHEYSDEELVGMQKAARELRAMVKENPPDNEPGPDSDPEE
jgi:hypothetical protein